MLLALTKASSIRTFFTRPGLSIWEAATGRGNLFAGDESFGCDGVNENTFPSLLHLFGDFFQSRLHGGDLAHEGKRLTDLDDTASPREANELYGFLREGRSLAMVRAQGFGSPRTECPSTMVLACTSIGLFAFPPASEHPLRVRHRGASRRGGSFDGSSPAPCTGEITLASAKFGGETPHRHASLASKPGGSSSNLLSPVFVPFFALCSCCYPIGRKFLL